MNTAKEMYALSLTQCVDLIKAVGHTTTVLLQGDMGNGKSSTLPWLAEALPTHQPCYFDCTTKDLGDIMVPKMAQIDGGSDFVTFAINEELGVHHDKPIILMIDEFGKANPAVKNALLRVILERKIGSYTLHPDSIVYCTTNKGAEGVGDMLPPHARNRMTIVQVRKTDHLSWLDWAINNGLDHTLLGYVKDNPQLFASFEDVRDPNDNEYIFHPQAQRDAFVTPRSLHRASDILKQRHLFDSDTLQMAMIGTVGEKMAGELRAYITMADQLPSRESVKTDPKTAKVPESASAVCMVVYRSLSSMDKDYIDPWMDYMVRLDKEAQGVFANGVRAESYAHRSLVMSNKKFTQWAMENNYMFASDKK